MLFSSVHPQFFRKRITESGSVAVLRKNITDSSKVTDLCRSAAESSVVIALANPALKSSEIISPWKSGTQVLRNHISVETRHPSPQKSYFFVKYPSRNFCASEFGRIFFLASPTVNQLYESISLFGSGSFSFTITVKFSMSVLDGAK